MVAITRRVSKQAARKAILNATYRLLKQAAYAGKHTRRLVVDLFCRSYCTSLPILTLPISPDIHCRLPNSSTLHRPVPPPCTTGVRA